ncbi:MAG: 30S ribosome-binding factor RbfA [Lachnospiraceae bacterium]|nr:30S ribosome-binding factor RbfA [Lachnospiraceae bacterium]
MRKNSTKNNRINGEVARALSQIIRDVKDPRVGLMTSVKEVVVAPDLKTCKVFISVLGNKKECEDTMAGLNSAKGFIRRELARIVNLRNTPELTFILDDSIAYGVDMSRRIDEVIKTDMEGASGAEEAED